jgi:phage tail sheath gpL-like
MEMGVIQQRVEVVEQQQEVAVVAQRANAELVMTVKSKAGHSHRCWLRLMPSAHCSGGHVLSLW